jgi:membrane fusion protein (multidrug efflux system)
VPVRIHVDVPNDARPVLVPGLSVVVDVDTRDLHPASAPASAAAHGASHG